VHRLCNQKFSNDTHHVFYQSVFFWGFKIKGFGWALIFHVNYCVDYFCPKLEVKSYAKIMFLAHSMIVPSAFFITPLYCAKYGTIVVRFHIHPKTHQIFWTQILLHCLNCKILIFMLVSFSSNTLYLLNLSNTYSLTFKG